MRWYTFICSTLNPCTMLAVPLSFVTNLGQFMVVYKSYEAIHSEVSLSDVLLSDQTLGHSSNPLQRLLTPFRISWLWGSHCISSGSQCIKPRSVWDKSCVLRPTYFDQIGLFLLWRILYAFLFSILLHLYDCNGEAD